MTNMTNEEYAAFVDRAYADARRADRVGALLGLVFLCLMGAAYLLVR